LNASDCSNSLSIIVTEKDVEPFWSGAGSILNTPFEDNV